MFKSITGFHLFESNKQKFKPLMNYQVSENLYAILLAMYNRYLKDYFLLYMGIVLSIDFQTSNII